MNEFLVTTLVGLVTGIAGWLTARRKNIAETHLSELDAVEKAIAVWRELGEQSQAKYEALLKRQDELEIEVRGLREDNERLVRENKTLVNKIKKLTSTKNPDAE